MKKLLGSTLAAGAAMLGATAIGAGNANAEAAWSFNAGIATDYMFRGIDQTAADEGEFFGGADLTVDQFYAGVWVSNTGAVIDPSTEYDLYAGWKPTLGGVNLDLGVIYYGYVDGDIANYSDANAFELKAAATVPLGDASLGAAFYWQPDFVGDADAEDVDGFYYEVNGAYTFANKASLSGAIGLVSVPDTTFYSEDSYVTYNVGVTYPITDHLSIDGRYIASDDNAFDGGYGIAPDKLVGTLKATF